MVIASLMLLCVTASPVSGVVAVSRGAVSITGDGARPIGAASGALLPPDSVVETGANGWVELHLPGDVRLRLSAATHMTIAETSTGTRPRTDLVLHAGRVWVQPIGRAVTIRTQDTLVLIAAQGSAVVESSVRLGVSLIPRRGWGTIAGRRVEQGSTGAIEIGSVKPVVRLGGHAITDLVVSEAAVALGDLSGIHAFLIERSARSEIARLDVRRVRDILRLSPEITGSDGGPAGALLEDAIRPAPFFDQEVPPRGPNVRVEVEFAE